MEQRSPKQKQNKPGSFMQYAGMGLQILAIIVVMAAIGIFIDKQLHWKFPLFTVLLSLAGVVGAMYSIIRKL